MKFCLLIIIIVMPPQTILESFRFLDLPIELRLAIFEIIFTVPATVLIQPPVTGHHGDDPAVTSTPIPYIELLPRPDIPINLLLTCRQICTDALPILYGRNTFQFEFSSKSPWSHYTNKFIKQIGPSNCALLRSAEIFFNFPYIFSDRPHATPCKFPTSIRLFTGLVRASVIVGTSEQFTEFRRSRGDDGYIRRMVRMLRQSVPQNCMLEWDVTGGHPQLERALDEVYGVDGYRQVETETKRKMLLKIKRTKESSFRYHAEYYKGVL
jgi:hypothetical protein